MYHSGDPGVDYFVFPSFLLLLWHTFQASCSSKTDAAIVMLTSPILWVGQKTPVFCAVSPLDWSRCFWSRHTKAFVEHFATLSSSCLHRLLLYTSELLSTSLLSSCSSPALGAAFREWGSNFKASLCCCLTCLLPPGSVLERRHRAGLLRNQNRKPQLFCLLLYHLFWGNALLKSSFDISPWAKLSR